MQYHIVDSRRENWRHFSVAFARRLARVHPVAFLKSASGNKFFQFPALFHIHNLVPRFKVVDAAVYAAADDAAAADASADADIRDDARASARAIYRLSESREISVVQHFRRRPKRARK